MAITFHCGHCGKSLTTSDDKAGLKAKCPGCGEVITVPDAEPESHSDADDVADEEDWEESDELPTAPAPMRKKASSKTGSKTCPMCGAENSPRAKTCVDCGEELPLDEEEPRRRRRGPRANIEVGEVMSDAWETFKANFGIALAANIIAGVIIFIGTLPLIALVLICIFTFLQSDGNELPHVGVFIGMAPAYLVSLAVTSWIMPGLLKFYIRISRQESDVDLMTVFQGGRVFLQFLGVSFVFTFVMTIASVLCGIPGVLVWIFFWPVTYLVADDEHSEGQYLQRTLELTKPNWVCSLLVTLVWAGMIFAIAIAGAIPCIGPIFSLLSILIQPYFQLLWATAYVKMSGQD